MKINPTAIGLGLLAAALFSLLGLAAIIALVILFGSAETLQDVMAISRFSAATSVMMGLGAAWGAALALRKLPAGHLFHGFLIGVGVGVLHVLLISNATLIGHLIALLLALPAGIFGARIAQLAASAR